MSADPPRQFDDNLVWMLSRPPIGRLFLLSASAVTPSGADANLVTRVVAAYQRSASIHLGTRSFWNDFSCGLKAKLHETLAHGTATQAGDMLRNPSENALFWGFDAMCKAPEGLIEPHEMVFRNLESAQDWETCYSLWLHDSLVSLAEAVGARRVHYPETPVGLHQAVHGEASDVDAVLSAIGSQIGMSVEFPNPYAGEVGIATSRGIASFRSFQSIYQAWRISQLLAGRPNPRVLEIGAGLGRTAFYAYNLGIRDYTIVDIPLTGAAQGYFLGRSLGEDKISLEGENPRSDAVKICTPESLCHLKKDYDLVLNVDSLTELDEVTSKSYYDFCRDNSRFLLSINHEFNPRPVQSLYIRDERARYSRHPYWMRRGYVEELIEWC